MGWPAVPGADLVTQRFGCTTVAAEWTAPWCSTGRFHSGIDLGSTRGGWAIFRTPVYATRAGTVVAIGEQYLGSQAVCLKLDEGTWLWYGHLDAALVLRNERVAPGQEVGLLGSLGMSTAPHLHLEARRDGPARNVNNQAAGVLDPGPFLEAIMLDQATIDLIHKTAAALGANQPVVPNFAGWSNDVTAKLDQLQRDVAALKGGTAAPGGKVSGTFTGQVGG